MSSQTADRSSIAKDTLRKMTASEQELIATPFCHLTLDEIREWE
jgi:hypothetical protein